VVVIDDTSYMHPWHMDEPAATSVECACCYASPNGSDADWQRTPDGDVLCPDCNPEEDTCPVNE
jgi:hypothetical protein